MSVECWGIIVLILAMAVIIIRVSFTLIALVFACVLFGMLAGNMGGKATRRVYMFLCGGFSVILSIVLIHSIRPF